ncbi:flavin reductase family protein [Gordonia neofelifaecis]|uniref:Oxidoreductase n=1 Tax=Gordonia neofelifaecis NRRL B-59395 TaxID=644548 RepID=F1YP22_9ACTN|nr:flavin reductase family protein [Gordonia neofelifaecis]EGD53527.1 oxidoreductase [Gordonia neofelifaecis NRRL B-59395]
MTTSVPAPAASIPTPSVPPQARAGLRSTMSGYPSGLVAVAALARSGPVGLIASSFTSVSLDPPLVSVNIANDSTTLPRLLNAESWGISVLAADQHHVADAFRRPSRERFDGVSWRATANGAVHLDGAAAEFTTTVRQIVTAGDHVIAVLAVADHRAEPGADPIVFYRSRLHRIANDVDITRRR